MNQNELDHNGLLEPVTPEGSIDEEGAKTSMPTRATPVEPEFIYPKEFNPHIPVSEISDEFLIRYHDVSHIFWNKYERGMPLDFGFDDLVILHYKIVKEMEKRKFTHFSPINSLDKIQVTPKDVEHYVEEMSKKKEQEKENPALNLSLEPPIILKENKM